MIFLVKPKRKGYAKAAAKPSAIKSENWFYSNNVDQHQKIT